MFDWRKKTVEVFVYEDEHEKIISWVIGKDVDLQTYEELKDKDGRLHVVSFYRHGVKETYITTKEHYEGAKAAAAAAVSDPHNLRMLAETGDASAQTSLGFLYSEGRGVSQDDVEATKWFRRAAEQGYVVAQTALGLAYCKGVGVAQDLVLAYMWCSLAAMLIEEAAKELVAPGPELAVPGRVQAVKQWIQTQTELAVLGREQAAKQMTQTQIAHAERLVREWKPKGIM